MIFQTPVSHLQLCIKTVLRYLKFYILFCHFNLQLASCAIPIVDIYYHIYSHKLQLFLPVFAYFLNQVAQVFFSFDCHHLKICRWMPVDFICTNLRQGLLNKYNFIIFLQSFLLDQLHLTHPVLHTDPCPCCKRFKVVNCTRIFKSASNYATKQKPTNRKIQPCLLFCFSGVVSIPCDPEHTFW